MAIMVSTFCLAIIIHIQFVNADTPNNDYTYQCYNKGITCSTELGPPLEPKSVQELQSIVLRAKEENITVKVIGNRHSISDCICTKGILISLTHFKQFSHDPNTNVVTAGPGWEAVEFLEKLHQAKCAVSGAPSFGGVTLGGVLAIGVHGTGGRYPTLLSDQLVSLSVVDGQGNLITVTKKDGPKIFNAFRVSLGLLGIIYQAQIQCGPLYKLQMINFPLSDTILRNNPTELIHLAKTNDVFQMWWFPTNERVVLSMGNRTEANSTGTCQTNFISDMSPALSNSLALAFERMQTFQDHQGMFLMQSYAMLSLYQCVPGRQPFYSESDGKTPCLPVATGWSHKMMSNKCTQCTWTGKPLPLLDDDTNVAIPLSKLPEALHTLRLIFEKGLAAFPLNGLYFRFLKPGNGLMAINYGEDDVWDWWVSIEWITVPRWDKSQPKLGINVYQAIAQALILLHGGRPHWGKAGLAYSSPEIILKAHGTKNVKDFVDVMNSVDPEGRFMNSFGKRIKFGKNVITVAPDFAKHCALNEVCFCENNKDCGNGTPQVDYTCEKFTKHKFRVCQPTFVEQENAVFQNATINLLKDRVNDLDFLVTALNDYELFTDGVQCGIGIQESEPC